LGGNEAADTGSTGLVSAVQALYGGREVRVKVREH